MIPTYLQTLAHHRHSPVQSQCLMLPLFFGAFCSYWPHHTTIVCLGPRISTVPYVLGSVHTYCLACVFPLVVWYIPSDSSPHRKSTQIHDGFQSRLLNFSQSRRGRRVVFIANSQLVFTTAFGKSAYNKDGLYSAPLPYRCYWKVSENGKTPTKPSPTLLDCPSFYFYFFRLPKQGHLIRPVKLPSCTG